MLIRLVKGGEVVAILAGFFVWIVFGLSFTEEGADFAAARLYLGAGSAFLVAYLLAAAYTERVTGKFTRWDHGLSPAKKRFGWFVLMFSAVLGSVGFLVWILLSFIGGAWLGNPYGSWLDDDDNSADLPSDSVGRKD